uniref:diphthine methyl ester synthase n=1 Tax=Meloidogyne javanica TaxID=6303 RepID=A0A915MYH7_MELJA
MVFYLVGLGLGDVTDITVKGLNIVRRCKEVYFENYTSLLSSGFDPTQLEKFYERPIIEADREFVEQKIEKVLEESLNDDIALLIVGDPFGATTHSDLLIRAKQIGVSLKVIHNASILTAVGCTGLQLYNFGSTVSIPFWTDNWEPDSFFEKILINLNNGMHTLCLLDIKIKEQSLENILRKRNEYEKPCFLTCSQAAKQIIKIIERNKGNLVVNADIFVVGIARIGWDDQKIVYATLQQLAFEVDMGLPLHSLIIPSFELHPLEKEMLNSFIFK